VAQFPGVTPEVLETNIGFVTQTIYLGSAPDSWRVWFHEDHQTVWERFLDELAGAIYKWLALGPSGCRRLPASLAMRSGGAGSSCRVGPSEVHPTGTKR
jgi:hypothetical protein